MDDENCQAELEAMQNQVSWYLALTSCVPGDTLGERIVSLMTLYDTMQDEANGLGD